jgi:GNAT superfamily N-acetyltransferase
VTAGIVVPTPSVRDATPDDVAVIVELAARAAASLDETRGGEYLLAREAPVPEASTVAAWITAGDATVVIGALDEVPVATAAARVEVLVGGNRLAVVPLLWVDDEARAVGVGEAVLVALIDWARAQGCDAIDAYALPGERATKNFFEAAGFKARLLTVHHRL